MGRKAYLRQYKKVPSDFAEFTRTRTDWDGILRALQHQAIGGQAVTLGNGQTIITTPDTKALALIIDVAYGNSDGNAENIIADIRELATKNSGAPLRLLPSAETGSATKTG